MGLYGSKDQHPKLAGSSSENDYLASIQWQYCEKCGNKHLKEYKKCPACGYPHRKKLGAVAKGWLCLAAVIGVTLVIAYSQVDISDKNELSTSYRYEDANGNQSAGASTPVSTLKPTTTAPKKEAEPLPLKEQLRSLVGDTVYLSSDASILEQCGIMDLRNAELISNREEDKIKKYYITLENDEYVKIEFTEGSLTSIIFLGEELYNTVHGVVSNINTVLLSKSKESTHHIMPPATKPNEPSGKELPSAQSNNWRITVENIQTYKTLDNILIEDPPRGKIFLAFFLEVENISDQDSDINYLRFDGYCDNYSTDVELFSGPIDGVNVLVGNVAAGKKRKGCLLFEADSDWKTFELHYDELFSTSETIKLVVERNDAE